MAEKEYIERKSLLEDLELLAKYQQGERQQGILGVCVTIKNKEAADVVEVKYGTWKLHRDGSGTCDQCGRAQKCVWDYDNWQNYCGCCGAKMTEVI